MAAVARDRRLAPRRLGSGRLGRADAEARRDDRLRPAAEPACLNFLVAKCNAAGDSWHRRERAAAGVRRRARLHVPAEARLRRHGHEEAALHAHVPDPSRGAMERRGPVTARRLRLHAQRTCRPPGSVDSGRARTARPRPPCVGRRFEDGAGRPPLSLRRLAHALPERPPSACPRGPEHRKDLDRPDRQPEDRQADRKRAVPRRALGARPGDDARPQSPLLGGARRLCRSVRRSLPRRQVCNAPPAGEVLESSGKAMSTSPSSVATGIASDLRRVAGIGSSRTLDGWEHSAIRIGPGGHPALRNKLVRQALAYGIDRTAIVRSCAGSSTRSTAARQRRLPETAAATTGRTGAVRYRPARGAAAARAGGLPARRGRHLRVRGQRLSLRFVTTAGIRAESARSQLIQAQLRQVGVEVVPTFAPRPALFGTILPSGDFDVALFGWLDPRMPRQEGIFGCGGRP